MRHKVSATHKEMDFLVKCDTFIDLYRDNLTQEELEVLQHLPGANRVVSDYLEDSKSVSYDTFLEAEEVMRQWNSKEFAHIRKKFDKLNVQFGRVIGTE